MSKLALILGGLAALGAAAPAAAVTAVSQCGSGSNCTIAFNGVAGNFGNSQVNDPSFTDIYTFDIASTGLLNFTLSTSYPGVDLTQDIDFSLVNLTGPGGVNSNLVSITPEPVGLYLLSNLVVAAGQYTLTLTGTAGDGRVVDASYAGTLNFTPTVVPEPSTWALLALGFGLVGTSLRTRRRISNAIA